MKHLIVWSGGYDSTAIVRSYLEESIDFDTLYITLENNRNKSKMEQHRRNRMKRLFYRQYGKKFIDINVKISEIQTVYLPVATFHQPHLWILGLIYSLKTTIEYDTVAFGYLKHADFWHIKDAIVDYYEAAKKAIAPSIYNKVSTSLVVPNANNNLYKFPTLLYPLEWYDKKTVIEHFYSDTFGKTLFNLPWTCELPIKRERKYYTSCDSCVACLYLKKQLNLFKEEEEERKKIRELVIDKTLDTLVKDKANIALVKDKVTVDEES